MKSIVVLMALPIMILTGAAAKADVGGPEGLWSVRDGRAKVRVEACQQGPGLCGNIIWLREPKNSGGEPLTDGNNRNPGMRSRPIIGLSVALNMQKTSQNKWQGQVYDPERGGTYDGSMQLLRDGDMKVTGCLTSFLCQHKIWKRIEK